MTACWPSVRQTHTVRLVSRQQPSGCISVCGISVLRGFCKMLGDGACGNSIHNGKTMSGVELCYDTRASVSSVSLRGGVCIG